MRHGLKALVLAALMFSGVHPASAVIITADPDNFSVGTNLTNAIPGVTVSHLANDPAQGDYETSRGDVFAAPCSTDTRYCSPAAGARAFGATPSSVAVLIGLGSYVYCDPGHFGGDCFDSMSVVELQFDRPTSFVQIGMTSSVHNLWPAFVAFDSSGNTIGFCGGGYQSPGGGCGFFSYDLCDFDSGADCFEYALFSLQLQRPDIARVVVGGTGDNALLTDFSFDYRSVPEPGTLALLALGLAGLGCARRRRAN